MLGAAAAGGSGSGPLSEERVLESRRQVESGRRPLPDNGLGVFTWISDVCGEGDLMPFPCSWLLGFHPGSSPGDSGNRSKETASDGGPTGPLLRFPAMCLGLTQKVSCNFSGF